jgi:hypothetical protein
VRKAHIPIDQLRTRYRTLMADRGIPANLDRAAFEREPTALLCSEPTAERCHRGILAEMLAEAWSATITHL